MPPFSPLRVSAMVRDSFRIDDVSPPVFLRPATAAAPTYSNTRRSGDRGSDSHLVR